jgi:transcriptional regulator
MRAHPFATLVSIQAGALTADHLPLHLHPELSEKGTLRGHIAKGNPLWTKGAGGTDVLAIFQGPQVYVTPSWYPSKKEHGKVVPTWNYAVVHAHGALRFVEDGEWLHEHLNTLTRRHEGARAAPWEVSDAPASYLDHMMKGIVGIEFEIERLEGKWKMSQNRNAQDRAGVRQGLLAEQDESAAAVSEIIQRFEHGAA